MLSNPLFSSIENVLLVIIVADNTFLHYKALDLIYIDYMLVKILE